MTTLSEVRAHDGIGYGAFTSAHFGVLYEEITAPAPIVVVPPARVKKRRAPQTGLSLPSSSGGAGLWLPPPLIETLDKKLECAARAIPELAKQEDTQRWASDVLSRSTEDLSTDLGVVSSLLRGAQAIVRSPVGRVTLLAGALVAAALPVVLVAHDNRPLTAVYVDGAWRYADPNADAALGTHLPFVRERFFSVPDLPAPERSLLKQEIEALRKQVAMQQEQIDQLYQMVAEQFQIQTRRSDGEVWKTVAIIAVAAAVILLLVQVQQQSDRRST